MDSIIEPNEKLFKAIKRNPNLWDTETGRPTSAAFKDSKGVSVDRDGNREDGVIVSNFIQRFEGKNVKAVIYVNAGYCREVGALVKYKPEPDNEYHSEIHDSPEKITMSSSKARKLAVSSTIVYTSI